MDPELAEALAMSRAEYEQTQRIPVAFPILWAVSHPCETHTAYFLQYPSTCTTCGAELSAHHVSKLESSLVSSAAAPRSIVIRPTVGSLHNYRHDMLLHVGITNSKGHVFNFDSAGCHIEPVWVECITVRLEASHLSDTHWDQMLQQHHNSEQTRKTTYPYHSLSNNCYDYAIRFLNSINFEGKSNHTKVDIVSRFIGIYCTPYHCSSIKVAHNIDAMHAELKVEYFESFFKVLKQVQTNGCHIALSTPHTAPQYTCDVCSKRPLLPGDHVQCLVCEDYDLCNACYRDGKVNGKHTQEHKVKVFSANSTAMCDVCSAVLSAGNRIHCLECNDYDLCNACYAHGKVNGSHSQAHRVRKW